MATSNSDSKTSFFFSRFRSRLRSPLGLTISPPVGSQQRLPSSVTAARLIRKMGEEPFEKVQPNGLGIMAMAAVQIEDIVNQASKQMGCINSTA